MKLLDIFGFCTDSLRRRKGRTVLTIIGVVVGVCAIVVMISLGIAVNVATDNMLQNWGDLRKITVFNYSSDAEVPALDDAMVQQFKDLPNVVAATPMVTPHDIQGVVVTGRNDKYMLDVYNIIGMDFDALAPMDYTLVSGSFDPLTALGRNKIPVYVGEATAFNFYDSTKSWRSSSRMVYPESDEQGNIINADAALFNMDTAKLKFRLVYGYDDQDKPKYKEYELVIMGKIKSNMMNWESMQVSGGVVMPLAQVKKLQTEYARLSKKSGGGGGGGAMMGMGGGGGTAEGYEQVFVKVDDVKNMTAAEDAIKKIGYQVDSMSSVRNDMQKQLLQSQVMLGGLAAISLFVAALNIANTMTMAIYERTKEIGVMKVLGCSLSNIRVMFLLESGMIGFLGGVVGVAISAVISLAMNYLPMLLMMLGVNSEFDLFAMFGMGGLSESMLAQGMKMSIIPWWLVLFAMLFATLVGLLSGIGPANRATRISSLEAIRHE